MSGDEVFALLAFGALILFLGLPKVFNTFQYQNLSPLPSQWRLVAAAFFGAELLLWFVLRRYSSFDVQNSPLYLTFYMLFGTAWLTMVFNAMRWLDWHYSEDVLERRNPAAAWAQAGSVIGILCSFAGANIGDGPSWLVVLLCSVLSTGALLAVWLIIQALSGWSAMISVDRHTGSGLLAGGYFIAGGIVAGRSVAGDWISLNQTLYDFLRQIWGLPVLGFLALAFQLLNQPKEGIRPYSPLSGAAAGMGLVFLALVWLGILGQPS